MDDRQGSPGPRKNWERIISRLLPLALALLMIWPATVHPTWWLWKPGSPASDLAVTHWPNAHFARRMMWEEGKIPLWRPTIMSGTPFAANPLAGLYYPPNWVLLFLPSVFACFPLTLGFNLSALAHLALAGVTMYLLMRRGFGTGFWAALMAAVAYQASPKVMAHLGAGHVTWVQAWPWLPLALLYALRAHRSSHGQAKIWALGTGLVLAVQFCADVRLSAYTLIATASLLLARTIGQVTRRRRSTSDTKERLKAVATRELRSAAHTAFLSLVVFAGLSACQWLPGLVLLPETTRSTMTSSDAAVWSLPGPYLSGLLLADHGGFHEWMTYVGVSTLVMAWIGGQALWRDPRRRWLGAWLVGLGTFAGWFSLGRHGGLFQLLWRIVPGMGLLRVPPRAWVLVTFTTAVLAGLGLDEIGRTQHRRVTNRERWKQTLLLGVAAFPPMFAIAYLLTRSKLPLNLAMFGLITPLTVALCRAPSWVSVSVPSHDDPSSSQEREVEGTEQRRAARNLTWLGIAGVLLVTLDLLVVDFTLIEIRSPEEVFTPGRAAATWLADQPGRFRIYSPSYSLPQHVVERYSLEMADGVDPLQLQPYADYLVRAAGLQSRQGYSVMLPPLPEGRDVGTGLADATPNAEMLGQLGVRYVAAAFPIAHTRLDYVGTFDDVYVYQNTDARDPAGEALAPEIVLADGRVLFRYRPQPVYGGWALSSLALVGVATTVCRALQRSAER